MIDWLLAHQGLFFALELVWLAAVMLAVDMDVIQRPIPPLPPRVMMSQPVEVLFKGFVPAGLGLATHPPHRVVGLGLGRFLICTPAFAGEVFLQLDGREIGGFRAPNMFGGDTLTITLSPDWCAPPAVPATCDETSHGSA